MSLVSFRVLPRAAYGFLHLKISGFELYVLAVNDFAVKKALSK